MKKTIAIILAVCLCLGLCACQSGVTGSKQSNKHNVLGVFLFGEELIIMDDFSNDAANRSLDLAVLTIGPNRYYSNSTYSAGYILHKYSHYYVPAGQSIPGGSPTIRMALCFEINTNDLSNETATLSMFDEEFTVDLTDLQTIDSVDGVYAVEENPAEVQMVDSTCQIFNECHETLGHVTGLGNGYYVTGSDFAYVNRRLQKFFNESANGGMSIHGEGGNDPEEILDPSLMSFDLRKVKETYPELGEKLEEYVTMLRELNRIIDVPGNTDRAESLVNTLRIKNAGFQNMFDELFHRHEW